MSSESHIPKPTSPDTAWLTPVFVDTAGLDRPSEPGVVDRGGIWSQYLGALHQNVTVEYAEDPAPPISVSEAAKQVLIPEKSVDLHSSTEEKASALFAVRYIQSVRSAWQQMGHENQAKADLRSFPTITRQVDNFFTDNEAAIQTIISSQHVKNKLVRHFSHNLMGVLTLPSISEETARVDMSVPFILLRSDRQVAIIRALGVEWLDLLKTIKEHDSPTLPMVTRDVTAQHWPLAILSVADLQKALLGMGSGARDVCDAFLKRPYSFSEEAQSIRRAYQRISQRASQRSSPFAKKLAVYQEEYANVLPLLPPHFRVHSTTENKQLIETLLELPYTNAEFTHLEPGQSIALSAPDEPLSPTYFNKLVDAHLELMGRSMYANMTGDRMRGVTTEGWQKLCIGSLMHENAAGSLRNLVVSRVPVTSEAPMDNPKSSSRSLTTSLRLRFQADLVSAGRSPREVNLEMSLVARLSSIAANWDSIYKVSKGIKRTTPDVLQSMREEALLYATCGKTSISWKGIQAARNAKSLLDLDHPR